MSESESPAEFDPGEFIVTTTSTVEGYHITKTIDVVTAECVFGLNVFKDMFAGISDFFGGRNKTTQNALRDARKLCLNELRREAALLGGNAVIGVDLDYSEFSGQGKSMLLLVASGTAVCIESKNKYALSLSSSEQLDLKDSNYRLYLIEKYQVRRHELLGDYVAINKLFSNLDLALDALHQSEVLEVERLAQEKIRVELLRTQKEEAMTRPEMKNTIVYCTKCNGMNKASDGKCFRCGTDLIF